MATNEDYAGREQSQVKHYILRHYLERFAHIIGFSWKAITYIDCFSGPWESQASDLSDTSFAIAIEELRKARRTHRDRGKDLAIRCFFLEENATAHARLKAFADGQTGVEISTRNATLLDSIPDILEFIKQGGGDAFPFIFIDPTGWTGFDLEQIQPLLQQKPGEVLINFMTEHIRRWIDDERPEIRDSIRRCFGTDEVFARLRDLDGDDFRERHPQEVEDELFTFYAERLRRTGHFPHTCPAVVLHPMKERTYFHLVYGTRHRKGVEVFKQVEKTAFDFQSQVREAAKEAERLRKTNQPLLDFEDDEPAVPSLRAVMLRQRYLAAALERIQKIRVDRKQVSFDEIWDAAIAFPLVWESDVKDWVVDQQSKGKIRLLGLKPNQRVPQWEEGHVVEFLD
jgi:three-Cys-motif partner protein